MTLGAIDERSQLTIRSSFCRLLTDVLVSMGAFILRFKWQVHRDQTRTSLTVGFTLFIAVALSGLRPSYKVCRSLVRPLRTCVCWTRAQAVRKPTGQVFHSRVYIAKVIPKSHNVNRFASNLALDSFELPAVEMSTAPSAM